MALTNAERQKRKHEKQARIASDMKMKLEMMFEFIKREAHYYQERSRHPSQYTDRMDYLLRCDRARIIDIVMNNGEPYKPEFEYPTPDLLMVKADRLLTEERAGYEPERAREI